MRVERLGSVLIAVFLSAAVAAVVAAIMVIGSPADQRQIALDRQRASDLRRIANQIEYRWKRGGRLPENIAEIWDGSAQPVRDPQTGEPYTYRTTGARSYQLCAVFGRTNSASSNGRRVNRFDIHERGLHCFDLNVPPRR